METALDVTQIEIPAAPVPLRIYRGRDLARPFKRTMAWSPVGAFARVRVVHSTGMDVLWGTSLLSRHSVRWSIATLPGWARCEVLCTNFGAFGHG